MKVVPENMCTAPLEGAERGPQSTATVYKNRIIYTVISPILTFTGGCGKTPGSTSLTGSSVGSTANHVPAGTGVSGHLIKGGSRECAHCSIGGVAQETTVDNCNRHTL